MVTLLAGDRIGKSVDLVLSVLSYQPHELERVNKCTQDKSCLTSSHARVGVKIYINRAEADLARVGLSELLYVPSHSPYAHMFLM